MANPSKQICKLRKQTYPYKHSQKYLAHNIVHNLVTKLDILYSNLLKKLYLKSNYLKFCAYTEEFAAHGANISCLALGQKSGLVLATGGSDNIVKLWKVDSETCFMVIYN